MSVPEPCSADTEAAATNGGWAFGSTCLKQQIAKALERSVTPLPREELLWKCIAGQKRSRRKRIGALCGML